MPNEVDVSQVRSFFGAGYPRVKVLQRISDDPTTYPDASGTTDSQPTYVAVGTRGSELTTPNWKVFKISYVLGAQGSYVFDSSETSQDNSIASNYLTLEYK